MTDVHQPVLAKRWPDLTTDELFDIVVLRTDVFYVEQRIDEQDFDALDRDPSTVHCWIADDSGAAAYLRVVELPVPEFGASRSFGRMAVRADRRREGLAGRLIHDVVQQYGEEMLVIHAQSYVVGLYETFGFTVVGEPFDEAGLPHRTMVRPLTQ